MRRVCLAFAGLAILIGLAGCETVKGVGRDITTTSCIVEGMLSGKSGKKCPPGGAD